MNPRLLRRAHLYLGALFAPVLLTFTISGAWQVYRFNDANKDGSYTPSKLVKTISNVHKNTTLGQENHNKTAIKAFVFLACMALLTTTILGIVMAYRFLDKPVSVTLCLLAGVVVPVALLYFGL
jgi:hypothetical protein